MQCICIQPFYCETPNKDLGPPIATQVTFASPRWKPKTAHHPEHTISSSAGTAKLVRIDGKIEGAKYRAISEENLMQSAKDLRLGRRCIFQHDNDPKHTARVTMEWFRSKHVYVLQWPSQSSDLNPIENLWQDLRKLLSPSNLTEFKIFCQEEWTNIHFHLQMCKAC